MKEPSRQSIWYAEQRDLAIEERDAAIARAEAAEDDLRELRENTLLALGLNPVDVANGMEDQSIAYLLGGLKERVVELEARLAEMEARADRNQGSADVLDTM